MHAELPSFPGSAAPPPRRGRRASRLALKLGLALLAGLLLLELALRCLLFSELGWARRLGAPFRRAELYCQFSGEEYWKLRARFAGAEADRAAPSLDARFGWLKPEVDPATLRHRDEARRGARRPVLLYGDSYAACFVPSEDCWQGQLERSELGGQYALLNYGMPGYGLDQILILLRATLDLYRERAPVVVIGVLVDDDLDRCELGLRDFPKPRFELVDGELVLQPMDATTPRAYVDAHPVGIASYVWRLLVLRSGLLGPREAREWIGESQRIEHKRALNRRILAEIEGELAGRGLEHFFLLFHSRRSARSDAPYLWQEPLLFEELARHGTPFVSSKTILRADMRRTGREVRDYYLSGGLGANHFTPATHALVFQALRDGLEGRF